MQWKVIFILHLNEFYIRSRRVRRIYVRHQQIWKQRMMIFSGSKSFCVWIEMKEKLPMHELWKIRRERNYPLKWRRVKAQGNMKNSVICLMESSSLPLLHVRDENFTHLSVSAVQNLGAIFYTAWISWKTFFTFSRMLESYIFYSNDEKVSVPFLTSDFRLSIYIILCVVSIRMSQWMWKYFRVTRMSP